MGMMREPSAIATREGRWWVVDVSGVGVTQGRTTREAERMAVDLVAVMLDVPAEEVSVKVEFRLGGELAAKVRSVKQALWDKCSAVEGGMGVNCYLPPGHTGWHNASHTPRTDGTESIGYPFHIQWPRTEWDRCAPQATASASLVTETGGTQTNEDDK